MQHIIELNNQAEKNLSAIAMHTRQSKDDILLTVIERFLLQQAKAKAQTQCDSLEKFLKPYHIDLKEFKFDRDIANER